MKKTVLILGFAIGFISGSLLVLLVLNKYPKGDTNNTKIKKLQEENLKLKEKIKNITPSNIISQKIDNNNECNTKLVQYKVRGNSMTPMFKNNDTIKVKQGYYKCGGDITRGDIVIYESKTTNGPIIKQIRVLPEDIVKFNDKGNMIVNGEILTNSVNKKYSFTEREINMLGLYVHNGKMQSNAFFAFGDNIKFSKDSRSMGGLGINGFKGKVLSD